MIAITNQILKQAGVVFTCAVIAACSADVSNPPPLNSGEASAGNADFSKYVAIGDSLTAGYADGALYLLGQQNSFPNIMAQQFADVGGGDFVQPLTNDNLGGLLFNGTPNPDFATRFVLNTETETPERLEGTPTNEVIGSGLNGMTFNNMGVPAAKSFHLGAVGYGDPALLPDANPFYIRFSNDPVNSSMILDAAGQAPSFYTLWIGSNDVIWYGFAGGDDATATDQTGSATPPSSYGQYDITDPTVFASVYAQLVAAFTAANPAVQGVLINIPDVTAIPYFTAVPYNAVPLDQASADALNDAYAQYNAGVAQALAANPDEVAERTINFVEGQNAVVILDEDLTDLTQPPYSLPLPSMRQANADDLIVFESAPKIGTEATPGDPTTVWGVSMPLLDADVLIPSETQSMKTAVAAYNEAIKAVADADDNLILFDAKGLFDELNSDGGIDWGTGSVNSDFATGGFFSLDGIHGTARGYAVFSNAVIDAINAGFNANVYKVDPANYPTVFLK